MSETQNAFGHLRTLSDKLSDTLFLINSLVFNSLTMVSEVSEIQNAVLKIFSLFCFEKKMEFAFAAAAVSLIKGWQGKEKNHFLVFNDWG
ncbi:MAG: hypothetical protein LAT81_14770 [Oceanicaulis sp.]|nr:hypothetical protein [Oceanicaulis sp.]